MKITPEMIENYDYIKCRVCGKYYKSLTRHVICKHDMDPDEYKETFDVDYIFCGRLREEIAEWGIKHSFSESGYVPRNKKQVVTELKKYKARHKPLERALLDRKDRSLLFQVYHIFGDLETLKEETGIVIEKVEKEEWSKDKVLEEIRHLHKKGIPLSHRSIKQADSKLLSAANRHFGSSRKAVEAAGFDAPKVEECKQWDKQKVIEGIKEYHKKSISLNTNSINRVEKKLYQAAQRHFGAWGKAVKAAGFDAFGVRKFKQWDKSKVIKAIKQYHKKGIPLNYYSIRKVEQSLIDAASRYFSSWREAVVQAGFDASKARKNKQWSKSKVIKTIKESHKKGIPLRRKYVDQAVPKLYGAAQRHFGSWKKAVEKAGFDASETRKNKQWSKSKVIEGIKEYHKKGISLNSVSIKQVDPKLVSAGVCHFGSWGKALGAAGFDPSEVRKKKQWDKSKIVEGIKGYHKKKVPLNYGSIKKKDLSLLYSAQRHFGSWGKAIEAAGFDYSQIKRNR